MQSLQRIVEVRSSLERTHRGKATQRGRCPTTRTMLLNFRKAELIQIWPNLHIRGLQAVELLKQKAGNKLASRKNASSPATPADNIPENRSREAEGGSTRPASALPPDFFDEPKAKKSASGEGSQG